jgi:hypothetical protein
VNPEAEVIIEVFGEGKADIRTNVEPSRPTEGVVPILLHRLCGRPERMRVKCKPLQFLIGKRLEQKVHFAKRQAHYNRSDAAVFVLDSEGGETELKATRAALQAGRDRAFPDFPMAVGVAHPCIESWLLADAPAIRRGLELDATPGVPDCPEDLPAPCRDRSHNPKTELCKAAGKSKRELSAAEKDSIAQTMNDMELVRQRCPLGFGPFAEEVEYRICPLF